MRFEGEDARLEKPLRLIARLGRAEALSAVVPDFVKRRMSPMRAAGGVRWVGYGAAAAEAPAGAACLLVHLGELHALPEELTLRFARGAVPILTDESYVLFYRGGRRLAPAPRAKEALRSLAWFLAQLRAHDTNGGLYRCRAAAAVYRCRRSASDIGAVEEAWNVYFRELPRLRAQAVVVDIGAHIGGFSVPMARLNPEGRLLAYEPDPESFALLRENLKRHGLSRVEAFPLIVSASRGRRSLYPCAVSPVRSSLFREPGAGPAVRVQSVSLPQLAAEHGLARIDLLKVDAEGAEYEILLPHARFLRARVDRLIVEAHPRGRRDAGTLSRFLRSCGFTVRRRGGPRQAVLFARRRR